MIQESLVRSMNRIWIGLKKWNLYLTFKNWNVSVNMNDIKIAIEVWNINGGLIKADTCNRYNFNETNKVAKYSIGGKLVDIPQNLAEIIIIIKIN